MANMDAITLFVRDPQVSKSFYLKAFAPKILFEDDVSVAFGLENIVLNLLQAERAPGLVQPEPVAPRESGARMLLTVGVPDTDAACEELAAEGIELLNGPQDQPWGLRTAAFADPDGHVWELASKLED
jgi:catechol 2,3-dioxygenase-like lactoylglutathione lyase family enzyme